MDFVGPLGQPSEFCSEDIEELKEKTDRIRSRRCWNCTGLPAVKMAA